MVILKKFRLTGMSPFSNTSGFPGLLATFILTDGWMSGWMDGWMDGSLNVVISRAPVEIIN